MKKLSMFSVSIITVLVFNSCATIALNQFPIHQVDNNQEVSVTLPPGTPPSQYIRSFSIEDRAGWLLGIIPVNKPAGGTKETYLKQILDRELEIEPKGDAIINLNFTIKSKPIDYLMWLVPFYSTRTVTITGDIIKYDN